MIKVLPTLTTKGFISDENLMMTKLYEYFLTTQYSQSVLYSGNIESYDKVVKNNVVIQKELENDLHDSIYNIYSKYFTDVEPMVKLIDHDINGNSVYKVNIEVTCKGRDGATLSLSKSLTMNDGKINEIAEVMDYFKS